MELCRFLSVAIKPSKLEPPSRRRELRNNPAEAWKETINPGHVALVGSHGLEEEHGL